MPLSRLTVQTCPTEKILAHTTHNLFRLIELTNNWVQKPFHTKWAIIEKPSPGRSENSACGTCEVKQKRPKCALYISDILIIYFTEQKIYWFTNIFREKIIFRHLRHIHIHIIRKYKYNIFAQLLKASEKLVTGNTGCGCCAAKTSAQVVARLIFTYLLSIKNTLA